MHGEYLLVDDGGDGQAIKAVRKCLPQLDVVPAFAWARSSVSITNGEKYRSEGSRTLVVEAIDSVDARTFMVTSQDEKVFGILDLVCEQEADGLQRLFTPVDVVAKEEIVGFWREPAVFEETQEIVVLSVNIACGTASVTRKSPRTATASPCSPHILMGASSSSRMGWLMKISRAFVQRYLISYSCSWTGFPGRFPRTGGKSFHQLIISLDCHHGEAQRATDDGMRDPSG